MLNRQSPGLVQLTKPFKGWRWLECLFTSYSYGCFLTDIVVVHTYTYYLFITTVLIQVSKLFAWGKGDSGGHVLRETTSRGLCRLVCPSRTSERGGKEDCVKEGGGEEGERERERALGVRLRHSPGY